MLRDISFKNEEQNVKFNLRVAALITTNDKILLQKSTKDNYYSLIGGRIKYLENSKYSLIREINEEIGLKINMENLKLNTIVENFFMHNNIKYHELLFIYEINNIKDLVNLKEIKTLDKDNVKNIWFLKKEIDALDIRPSIVKEILNNKNIQHYILKEY